MQWIINKSYPICPQIFEQICLAIANQEIKPHEKIFSVRELALKLGVNPNTVQKSFELLEEQGIIYSIRGSGWYVSEDINTAKNVVDELKLKKTEAYFLEMKQLGYSIESTIKYLNERYGNNNE